jgi:hypothetical protein
MPRFTDSLTTDILINAPPAAVWAVLADLPGWTDWNPFITAIAGDLRPGGRITAAMAPQGRRAVTFRPTVQRVDVGRHLSWRGRLLMPGLFDGTHSFDLTPEGAGTRLTHAETFAGLFVPLVPAQQFAADFARMNAALKARAER